jgi:multidrug efflux system membrane fusion protein
VDGLRVVRDGLKPGEKIVVNGLQRVRPGAPITPKWWPWMSIRELTPSRQPARKCQRAGKTLEDARKAASTLPRMKVAIARLTKQ